MEIGGQHMDGIHRRCERDCVRQLPVRQLYAFNADTGALLWISDKYPGALPVVANGILYLGTEGSSYGPGVIALRADTELSYGIFRVDAVFNSPAVAYGTVYLQSSDSYLYALNAQTGQLQWAYYNAPSTYISPVVANGVVYTVSFAWGSNDGMQAVNALTGQLLWQDKSLFGSTIVATGGCMPPTITCPCTPSICRATDEGACRSC